MLEGYRALDLTGLPGQLAGRVLSDLGMEVVKVEPPGGDAVRRLGPFKNDVPHLEGSLRFAWLNAGKRSLTLDVETSTGQALFRRLAAKTDVVLESFSPGRLQTLGLDYAGLSQLNPGLVLASLSGFGQDGPYRDYRCPDSVGLAMGGLTYMSGDPDLPPLKAPETQAFYYGSMQVVFAVLLAVLGRDAEGCGGQHIDVSIQESVATLENVIRESVFDGVEIKRAGSQHKHVAPGSLFPCIDGGAYIFNSRGDWERLLAIWPDHPSEFDEERWSSAIFRRQHAAKVNEALSRFTRRHTKIDLMELLQAKGIPCMPVNAPSEYLADPHTRARATLKPIEGAYLGSHTAPGYPVLLNGKRLGGGNVPSLGEANLEIYGEWLDLSLKDVEALFAEGII